MGFQVQYICPLPIAGFICCNFFHWVHVPDISTTWDSYYCLGIHLHTFTTLHIALLEIAKIDVSPDIHCLQGLL